MPRRAPHMERENRLHDLPGLPVLLPRRDGVDGPVDLENPEPRRLQMPCVDVEPRRLAIGSGEVALHPRHQMLVAILPGARAGLRGENHLTSPLRAMASSSNGTTCK